MRHILISGMLCLVSSLVFGQKQEEKVDGYLIRGVLDGKYKAEKVYLLAEDGINGPTNVIDSCVVVDNKYTFKGPKPDVVKMYFIKSGDPDCLSPLTPVFLENGIINIRANSEFFLNSNVRGTVNNELFNFYNFLTNYVSDSLSRAYGLEQRIHGERDYEFENAEFKRRTELNSRRNREIQRGMVEKYKDQVIAPFMLYWAMRFKTPLEELKALRQVVDPSLNEHPYTRQLDEYIRLANFNVGSMIPDFVLPDQNGKKVDIRSFRGKYVLIDFWASWCGPCLREMPNVVKLYKECKGKNFEILGISLDSEKNDWLAAVKKNNMKWTQLSELKKWDTAPVKLCNVQAVPYTVLVDPDGNVIALNLRGEELSAKVKEVLGLK